MKRGVLRPAKIILASRASGGVLQLTLGIGLVISIICASMIMLVYFNKLAYLKHSIADLLRENSRSGIQYAMANRKEIAFNAPVTIDLFEAEIDSVEIIRRPWGLFEAVTSKASRGGTHYVSTALITPQPDEIGKSALYLPDHNAPLYLVGKTAITGVAYISERKFSTGAIDGKGYEGRTFINGDTKLSETKIPQIDSVLIHAIKELMHQGKTTPYNAKWLDNLESNQYSFNGTFTNYYFSTQPIELMDTLQGNLVIQSSVKVKIHRDAKLNDIIVIAPEIDIEDDFSGTLQCFASKMITVGKGSLLRYPSSLALIGEENDSTIVLRENAQLNGVVIIAGYDQNIGSKGYFTIEKNARLHGMAYVNGAANIQGSIWGHITTRSFVTRIETIVYGNHVRDAELNGAKRSPDMPGSFLWAHKNQMVIAKWLE